MSEIKINNIPVITENNGSVELTTGAANIGNNAFVIDSSGDALIGTTSKTHSAKLTVNKTSGVNTTIIAWTDSLNNTGKLSIRNGSVVGIGADGNLAFSTGELGSDTFNERMRIDSSGHVTMPYQPAFSVAKSDVSGQIDAGVYVFNSVHLNREG